MDPKDAYICYNQADFGWVQRLAEQIESETIDGSESGRPLVAFFDRWDIDAGQSLIDQMNAGMNAARHVVAVIT
jgi:TIR domain